jgi:hypothetical protein
MRGSCLAGPITALVARPRSARRAIRRPSTMPGYSEYRSRQCWRSAWFSMRHLRRPALVSRLTATLSPPARTQYLPQAASQPERKMAGVAQGDRSERDASSGPSGSRHNLRGRPVRRHSVRSTVAPGGGEPGQCARRRRNRTHRHGIRARQQWRPDRGGKRAGNGSSRSVRHARGSAPIARRLFQSRLRRRRRPDLLWT